MTAQFKKEKPKKVEIRPPASDGICHNLHCRCRLRKHWKELCFQNMYTASVCLLCFNIICKKGLKYKGLDLAPELLKVRR